jgi:hypothetical protein
MNDPCRIRRDTVASAASCDGAKLFISGDGIFDLLVLIGRRGTIAADKEHGCSDGVPKMNFRHPDMFPANARQTPQENACASISAGVHTVPSGPADSRPTQDGSSSKLCSTRNARLSVWT